MSERYDILFRGDIGDGFFLQKVKEDLARLMKAEVDAVAPLFSGRAERLKKNVDGATADKYKKVLENIGMIVELRAAQGDAPEKPKVAPKKAEPVAPPAESSISLAPPGADVLDETTREAMRPEPVSVSTDHISVSEPDGNLLHDDEREVMEEVSMDLSAYDVSEVGEDLLTDDEKTEFVPLDIDMSSITMSDVGADLQDEKEEIPVPIPDIEHIELSDDLSGNLSGE